MKFEYYVLNYNSNRRKVEMFNIFNNWSLQEETEKIVKKYLRAPKNYKYIKFNFDNDIEYYGFKAFCENLKSLIMWQEWSRCQYEIAVGDIFTTECKDILREYKKLKENDFRKYLEQQVKKNNKLEKWDCYKQCEPNIEMIAREVIYQYKQQIKESNNEKI